MVQILSCVPAGSASSSSTLQVFQGCVSENWESLEAKAKCASYRCHCSNMKTDVASGSSGGWMGGGEGWGCKSRGGGGGEVGHNGGMET